MNVNNLPEFFIGLKNALPILLGIFISVFAAILLTRLILTILLHFALKKSKKLKKLAEFVKKGQKKFNKEDEELLRKLDAIPKAHSETRAGKIGKPMSAHTYELITSDEQDKEKEAMNKVAIVDIVKPIGFWTSMILGQKLTYLIQSAQIINKRGNQGFWVSMIEAQEQAAGREHGRMR